MIPEESIMDTSTLLGLYFEGIVTLGRVFETFWLNFSVINELMRDDLPLPSRGYYSTKLNTRTANKNVDHPAD